MALSLTVPACETSSSQAGMPLTSSVIALLRVVLISAAMVVMSASVNAVVDARMFRWLASPQERVDSL